MCVFYVLHRKVNGFRSPFFFSFFFLTTCSWEFACCYLYVCVQACRCVCVHIFFSLFSFYKGWVQMPDFHLVFISHGQRLWCSCQSKQVMHLLTFFSQANELLLSWCQHFARPVKETFLVVGCWVRPSVVGHNLFQPESCMVLSGWYSSVCPHVPHTQCFMQCSVYNDASLVLGCVCVCAFFQSEVILAFLYFFKGLVLG